MINEIRSFLIGKVYNRIRFIRYPAYNLKVSAKNIRLVKIISNKLNFKEYKFRKNYCKKNYTILSNIFEKKLHELNVNGFTIFTTQDLKQFSGYEKNFNYFYLKFSSIDFSKYLFNKIFYYISLDFKDENLKNLINIFLPLVSKYLEILPVVSSASVWYSVPNESEYISSQLPHFDPEDNKQIKIFVALEDIDKNNGALEVYDKKQSENIKNDLKIKGIELNKKLNLEYFKSYQSKTINLKKGEIALVDTCGCYHYGGRNKSSYRKQLSILLNNPFSMYYPLLRFFDKNIDPVWDYKDISYDNIRKSTEFKIF